MTVIAEKTKAGIAEELKLTFAEETKLDAYVAMFDSARDSNSVEELRSIVADEEFQTLAENRDRAVAFSAVMEGYDDTTERHVSHVAAIVRLTREALSRERRHAEHITIASARIKNLEATVAQLELRLRAIEGEPHNPEDQTQ
jgi:hypothetical protein